MKRVTKQKVCYNKREMSKTGGGVADLVPISDTERLIETQIGKASLHGLGGMDTDKGEVGQLNYE
jgi:hypothetical protein